MRKAWAGHGLGQGYPPGVGSEIYAAIRGGQEVILQRRTPWSIASHNYPTPSCRSSHALRIDGAFEVDFVQHNERKIA